MFGGRDSPDSDSEGKLLPNSEGGSSSVSCHEMRWTQRGFLYNWMVIGHSIVYVLLLSIIAFLVLKPEDTVANTAQLLYSEKDSRLPDFSTEEFR